MKIAPLYLLASSMALPAMAAPQEAQAPKPAPQQTAKASQEAAELRELREAFGEVLDTVRDSWFGKPYQKINAVDITGNLVLAVKGGAIDTKIEQLTQGAVKSPGVKSGQAFCTLKGTYFANGDHLYNVTGDLGAMRFQRQGDKGFWSILDQGVYTTAISSAPPNAPLSFMGWFADMVNDIREVYVKGPTFKVSKGKNSNTIVFEAPTAAYDPKKREQAASETFSFWKRGRMEVAYDATSKQPTRMDYSNVAQGVEATMSFTYDANGRVKQVAIANRSKQWEGPGFVSATYNADGMMTAIAGEITGASHKIMFNLLTAWNPGKPVSAIQSLPGTARKIGGDEMKLQMAMLFAGNIGDLQRAGFNVMAPKVSPPKK